MENPELIKSLARVPELENQIRRVLADNENKFSALAKAAEQRVQAVVPPEEIKKVSAAAEDAVRGTTCRFPDTSVISRDIAAKVGQDVKEQVSEAVKQAIGENPVRHIHEYTTLKDLYNYAPKSLQKKIRWMVFFTVLFATSLGLGAYGYFTSNLYWGARYAKVCQHASSEEWQLLTKDAYSVSFLPKAYREHPNEVKAKIRQLRQRQRDQKAAKRRAKK